MDKAGINCGDLVIVRQQPTARDGDRVVALIDDEATIKEIHFQSQSVLLRPKSTNKSHKPILVTNDFQIQGLVIGTIRNWEKG
jgi:repressor LexA